MKYSFFTSLLILIGIISASVISQYYLQSLGLSSGSILGVTNSPVLHTVKFTSTLLLWTSIIYVPLIILITLFIFSFKKSIKKS